MYLLGFSREQVCEPKTNVLFWKFASKFIVTDLPERMAAFQVMVEKPDHFKAYATLNFCEKVLSVYTEEEIQNYNAGFLKLFKWLKMAIEARKAYITRVKALTKRAKKERTRKQEQAEERLKNRENYLLESIDKFNEEHREEIAAYEEY